MMKRWLLFLFVCVAVATIVVAQSDSAPGTADTSAPARTDSVALDTAETAGAAVQEEPLYPLSPERKAKLIAYSRFTNIWRFADFFITLGILSLVLFTGFSAKLRDWAKVARKKFFIFWLFLIMFIVVDYLLSFPFHVYRNYIVEADYGFMNQTFLQWWGEDLLGLSIGCVIGIVPFWFFYWLVEKFRRWWLWFSIGSIPIMVFFIVIAPVVIAPLFNKFEPLQDKQLEAEILDLASKAGIEGSDVFQVNASKQSTKINAYVTGLFGTKRIVLFDNLIDNFTYDEIKFVMGHEMGHYIMHHIWWMLLLSVVFLVFILWLTDKTIHRVISRFRRRFRFDRLSDIASFPLVLIYLTIIGFIFQPITNGASRYMEHQADKFGMDVSGVSGETAAIAFDKLSVFNLSDPDPHWLIEFWFYNHPSLKKRMEFVREYRSSSQP
jgi:Zn-dependent protease with chaperone function